MSGSREKTPYFDCLIAAGTTESREAAEALKGAGLSVLATAATELGREMLSGVVPDVHVGRLNEAQFGALIVKHHIRLVVDATHPFAAEVTKTLQAVCKGMEHVSYIRYVREAKSFEYEPILMAEDAAEAAALLQGIKGNILLTTGANTVNIYKQALSDFNQRVYIRVLNTPESIARCRAFHVDENHIIAQNPPFTAADNIELIKKHHIKALVSKDSGMAGGLAEKIDSARHFGIPVILIKRPLQEEGVSSPEALIKQAAACFDKSYGGLNER